MSFFEDSAAVPLIVSAPRRFAAGRVSSNVSLLDIMPTIAEIAGVRIAPGTDRLDGASLVGALEGDGVARADTVVAEYLAEGAIAPVVMIRRGSLKLISSPGDPDQLFDLSTDPDELTNLAGVAAHAKEVASLREEVARRWDLRALRSEVIASQRRRRLIASALSVGSPSAWDYEPGDDSARRYVRGFDFWAPFKHARLPRRHDAPPGSSTS
jgi:choline-sulfatase